MSREVDRKKINDFINVYCNLLGLDKNNDDHKIIYKFLKDSIYRRAEKYKNIKVPTSIDNYNNYIIKPTGDSWNIEDFLLNRLFSSLRQIDINSYDLNSSGMLANYVGSNGELDFSIESVFAYNKGFYKDNKDVLTSTFKTFSHEIGHALKSQYTGGYKYKTYRNDIQKNNLYLNLIDKLKDLDNGKYKDEIIDHLIDEDKEMKLEKTGVQGIKNAYIYNQQMYIMTFIDEMMNEDEAVELLRNITPQKYTRIYEKGSNTKSNYYLEVPNISSGYCKYYGIGIQFKHVLGKNRYFQLQYGDSDKVLESFDNYFQDISNEMFGENKYTPSQIIYYNNISIGKSGRAYDSFLETNEFLARCYKKRLEAYLANENIDEETLTKILNEIDEMISYSTHHVNKEIDDKLNHLVIYKELKELVRKKIKDLSLKSMLDETTSKDEQEEKKHNY